LPPLESRLEKFLEIGLKEAFKAKTAENTRPKRRAHAH